MSVEEWLSRLDKTFGENGIIGARLLNVTKKENDYASYALSNFKAYNVLTDSFLDFYIETFEQADKFVASSKSGSPLNYYPMFLVHFYIFRSFRAAETLFYNGYPLSGYSLLRDIKDRAVYLSALLRDETTMTRLQGFDKYGANDTDINDTDINEQQYKEIRKRGEDEERRVLKNTLRKGSGLKAEILQKLDRWEKMFNEEVHGSFLSSVREGYKWLSGERLLSFGPVPEDDVIAMYVNRSNQVGWMVFKTFPIIQTKPNEFGMEWEKKWKILDESFREAVEGLGESGNNTAYAIIDLVDNKFNFNPSHFYLGK